MSGLPMRYYLYVMTDNHDHRVDLIFVNYVQLNCNQGLGHNVSEHAKGKIIEDMLAIAQAAS